MKRIPLTKGQTVIVDDEDYEFLSQFKWYAYKGAGGIYYAARNTPLAERINGKKKRIHMHRLLNNTPDGYVTDHINGDSLDNRKSNLRTATQAQNLQNKRVGSNSYSGLKGVGKRYRKWRAYINLNSKKVYIGSYDSKEDAAIAYNEAAIQHFGQFARLNIIQ